MAQRRKFDRLILDLKDHYKIYTRYLEMKKAIMEACAKQHIAPDKKELEAHLLLAVRKLAEMNDLLQTVVDKLSDTYNFKVESMLAVVHLHLAYIHADTDVYDPQGEPSIVYNREISDAYLKKIIEVCFVKHGVKKETVLAVVGAHVESARNRFLDHKFKEAVDLCLKAEQICTEFRSKHRTAIGFAVQFGFRCPEEDTPDMILDANQLSAINILAKIYATVGAPTDLRLEALEKGISAQEKMFQRLHANKKNYGETIENILLFARYFREQKNFAMAKYHMGAAEHMLFLFEGVCAKAQKKNDSQYMQLYYRWRAEVFDQWGIYGLHLMKSSAQVMEPSTSAVKKAAEKEQSKSAVKKAAEKEPSTSAVKKAAEKEPSTSAVKKAAEKVDEAVAGTSASTSAGTSAGTSEGKSKEEIELEKASKFSKYEKEIEAIVDKIPDELLTNYDDMAWMFRKTKNWMEDAMTYYKTMGFIKAQVRLCRNISQLYESLIIFAPDNDRKWKMHKKRIVLLEECLSMLDPTKNEQLCIQTWMELGDAYIELRNAKYGLTEEGLSEENKKKVDELNDAAMKYLELFRESLKEYETEEKEIEEDLPADYVTQLVLAYLHLQQLYDIKAKTDPEYVEKCQDVSIRLKKYYEKKMHGVDTKEELGLNAMEIKYFVSNIDKMDTQE